MDDFAISGFAKFVLFQAVLAVTMVILGVKQVPQGYGYTVERFGRYMRTLTPGLHFVLPAFDRIGAKLNMMEQHLDVPAQTVNTRGKATVAVDGVVFFQVVDCEQAAYEVTELTGAMLKLVLAGFRTVVGTMELDQLLSRREVVNQRLRDEIDGTTSRWGVKVTRVEIRDIVQTRDPAISMAR